MYRHTEDFGACKRSSECIFWCVSSPLLRTTLGELCPSVLHHIQKGALWTDSMCLCSFGKGFTIPTGAHGNVLPTRKAEPAAYRHRKETFTQIEKRNLHTEQIQPSPKFVLYPKLMNKQVSLVLIPFIKNITNMPFDNYRVKHQK